MTPVLTIETEPPDLAALSDEELLALLRACCAEAVRRGGASADAARSAYLSAAERAAVETAARDEVADRLRREEAARVAREAEDRARVREELDRAAVEQARQWGKKKGIAAAVTGLFRRARYKENSWGTLKIEVWMRGADKRVYLGYGFGENKVEYHATGNARHPPGALVLRDRDFKPMEAEVISLCAAIAAQWNAVRFMAGEALAWPGASLPLPGHTPPTPEVAP